MSGQKKIVSFKILDSESGLRLDLLLSRKYGRVNRATWQERIRKGEVLLNHGVVRPSRNVQTGDTLTFSFEKPEEPPVTLEYGVLYEDDELLAVDKPSNLPVHPSGVYNKHTLYFLLKERFGEKLPVRFVHRLDRETSGAILVAKSKGAASAMQRAFQSGSVRKEYLVLVEGGFPEYLDARGILEKDERSPVHKKRKFILTGRDRAPVRTEFFCLGTKGDLSLLRARLHTGRLHQIRATLCSLGYPVVGDRLYGIDDRLYLRFINDEETELDRRRLRMGRTALHSRLLEFAHPKTGAPVSLTSPLPKDMASLNASLEAASTDGFSDSQLDEIRASLRDLGLRDELETEE